MYLDKRRRITIFGALLLGSIACTILVMLATAGKSSGAKFASANRCPTRITANSVAYNCWAAYPESFHMGGFTFGSTYRLTWKVSCGRKPVSGKPQNVSGVIYKLVGKLTETPAYRLMIGSDVCKIDVAATRVSGNGSIHLELFINQNHPLMVHN